MLLTWVGLAQGDERRSCPRLSRQSGATANPKPTRTSSMSYSMDRKAAGRASESTSQANIIALSPLGWVETFPRSNCEVEQALQQTRSPKEKSRVSPKVRWPVLLVPAGMGGARSRWTGRGPRAAAALWSTPSCPRSAGSSRRRPSRSGMWTPCTSCTDSSDRAVEMCYEAFLDSFLSRFLNPSTSEISLGPRSRANPSSVWPSLAAIIGRVGTLFVCTAL